MKNGRYIKIRKDIIWWLTKFFIFLMILYIIYSTQITKFEDMILTFPNINFFMFLVSITFIIFLLHSTYMIGFEWIGSILGWSLNRVNLVNFDEVKKFDIKIPITLNDIRKFDSKFLRKKILIDTVYKKYDKEGDYDFCDRIIKEAIDEKLRKGDKK